VAYFRLVKQPNAIAKQRSFERVLAGLRDGQSEPESFRYSQGDFDAIPGAPWVYWITPRLRKLFREAPKLATIAPPRHGLSTCNNFRFLRFWWELGTNSIAFNCLDSRQAEDTNKTWFPYMKGGSFKRWYGNQSFVVNWRHDGLEIKLDIVRKFPYLKGNWGMVVTNPDYYFHRGVTWPNILSGRFSARLSPGGFIFDVSGSSAFSPDILLLLAVLNSAFAQYALKLINPTINVQIGDIARLPFPTTGNDAVEHLVGQAIVLA